MKIKVPNIEFQVFNDGVCDIYYEEDEHKDFKYKRLGFNERVLGFKRYFAAASAKVEIKKIIRIPYLENIDDYDTIEIEKEKYEIKLIQAKYDTNPKCLELTLNIK